MMKTVVVSAVLVTAAEATRSLAAQTLMQNLNTTEGTVKCEYRGPPGSGLYISFGVKSCNDCSHSVFNTKLKELRLESPFRESFTPVLLDHTIRGRDLCACTVGDDMKLVMETRGNKCEGKNKKNIQDTCWRIYKKTLGFIGSANAWFRITGSSECMPCIGKDCDHLEMPKKLDMEAIGRLQLQAKNDSDAANALENIERLGAVTAKYMWVSDDWSPCSKPCADKEGPGITQQRHKCVKDGETTRSINPKVCEIFLGPAPEGATGICNEKPCTTFMYKEMTGDDEWSECSKTCRDTKGPEGAGTQVRQYSCVSRDGDEGPWVPADEADCTAQHVEKPFNKEKDERACNQDACTFWAASVFCQDIDGEVHEDADCQLPAPTLADFMALDTNGDGALSPEELAEWQKLGGKLAVERSSRPVPASSKA